MRVTRKRTEQQALRNVFDKSIRRRGKSTELHRSYLRSHIIEVSRAQAYYRAERSA